MGWRKRAGNLVVNTVIHLAERKIIDDSVNEILTSIKQSTPEVILSLAQNDGGLIDVDDIKKREWERRIKAGARAAMRARKVDYVRKQIDALTPEEIFEYLVREAHDEEDVITIQKLSFIVQTPIIMKWYKKRVKEFREWILQSYDKMTLPMES